MPIEKSPGYKTSDGTQFTSLAMAQQHELAEVLVLDKESVLIGLMVENAEAVISILRATGRKPRAKKAKVGRPRKVKSVSVAANGDTQINNNKEKAI